MMASTGELKATMVVQKNIGEGGKREKLGLDIPRPQRQKQQGAGSARGLVGLSGC